MFSSTYAESRARFREAAAARGFALHALPLSARGPDDLELTIDVAARGEGARAFVHSCGLHGVEGFAGAATQLALLHDDGWPDDTRVILAHALNPYGMAWNRRVNESNVDLNRNFRDFDQPAPATPADYEALYGALHAPGSDLGVTARVVLRMLLRGQSRVKQAVTGGQYTHPDGLFYGGAALEEGPRAYRALLEELLSGCARVTALDVHTGLGTRGEDTILAPYDEGDARYAALQERFGFRLFPMSADKSAAYDIEGGYCRVLPELVPGAEVVFVTQEHGTVSPVEVLLSLVREHEAHRAGAAWDHPARLRLRRAFCLDDDEGWRAKVVERGGAVARALLAV
jgi:hypothetical protein